MSEPGLRVTVAVRGRFHAFQLARELATRGCLHQLLTSLPRFVARRHGVPAARTRSLVAWELAFRGWHRLPGPLRVPAAPAWIGAGFDRAVARRLRGEEDVFVGWSSTALHCLRRAKRQGVVAVLERGSSHIVAQTRLLEEEYGQRGLRAETAHPAVIERELIEYEEADYVSLPSSFARRTFVEAGIPEEKLLVNPYGVNLESFRPGDKRDDTFRVIHAGALSLRKGLPYLLQAFAELALPDAELWLVGGMREEVRPFLARWGRERVFHKGPYPEAALPDVYAQGSVLCLASVEEGFGMVQLQAMACGLPVVCTANSAGEDLVGDGREGFVVPIRDVEALKEKLLFLYENREARAAMGEAARQRVARGFAWADYGERAVAHYRRILACR